jgi:hypothetical protein
MEAREKNLWLNDEITLYHDFSSESIKTRKAFDGYKIRYKSIVSNPESNWYLPFIFIGNISYRITGIDQIISILFEEVRKNKRGYYEKIRIIEDNSYVKSKNDLWMLESLFGEEEVFESLVINEMNLSEEVIERLMEKSEFEVYINNEGTIITSQPTELMQINFGSFHKMNTSQALALTIPVLEEIKEKGYFKFR